MKTLKWSVWVVLVIGVSVLTVKLLTPSPRIQATEANEATEANQQSQEAEPDEPVQPAPVATAPVRKPASAAPPTPDKTDAPAADIASQPARMMRVRADQVLAKVNDRVVQLKDLVPLQPDEQEQAMTREEYESRLNRAIEMELTFQTAAAVGVDLTPEQKRRVDGVARRHEATLQEYGKQGFTWTTLTVAQVEFEQRLTAALMLQQNLVAAEAKVKPSPDASIQARYEDALRELMVRLKSNSDPATL